MDTRRTMGVLAALALVMGACGDGGEDTAPEPDDAAGTDEQADGDDAGDAGDDSGDGGEESGGASALGPAPAENQVNPVVGEDEVGRIDEKVSGFASQYGAVDYRYVVEDVYTYYLIFDQPVSEVETLQICSGTMTSLEDFEVIHVVATDDDFACL